MSISWSTSAVERSSFSPDDLLALTGVPVLDVLGTDLDTDDLDDAERYRAGEEPETQLVPINGAPTVIYTSVEVEKYLGLWASLNGKG